MKHISRWIIIGMVLCLILAGCQKRTDDNSENTTQTEISSKKKAGTDGISAEEKTTETQTGETEKSTQAAEDTSTAEADNNKTSSAEDELNVDDIAGFQKGDSNKDDSKYVLPCAFPGTNLMVQEIGSYMGPFVEDGSDEPMENVASVIVTNQGDKMVQYAELRFQVGKKEYVFKISNVPAGQSVLALEADKQEYKANKEYVCISDNLIYAETDSVSLHPDEVSLESKDNVITLENISGKELTTVYVYYKNLQSGGAYLGGITYRVKYENVKAGDKVEKETSHYSASGSRIVMVDIIN